MSRIRIAPIVEGHGEFRCIRTLLDRVWREVCGGEYIDVIRPVRQSRSKLIKYDQRTRVIQPDVDEIKRAVKLACLKLVERADDWTRDLVLLMLDADQDCPKELLEAVQGTFGEIDPRIAMTVVFPCIEYETWFVAAAASLQDYLVPTEGDFLIADPERARCGKSWIERRFAGGSYSETVDQIKLTAAMNLGQCRERSQSFDKLCRELEKYRSLGLDP